LFDNLSLYPYKIQLFQVKHPVQIIILALSITLVCCQPDKKGISHEDTTAIIQDSLPAKPDSSMDYYGTKINKFNQYIDTFKVAKNSVFSNLFDGYTTNDSLLFEAISASDSIFKVSRIIAGKPVHMIYSKRDNEKLASHLIYHASERKKLILGFGDSAFAKWYELPVDTVERTVYATINKTLYHSILAANVSYELGIELSEVFAWQVNFFRIDKNDFFKVVFDEYQADGKTIEIGEIKAALFYHRGDSFHAIAYNNPPDVGYFDEHGQNLKKAFLKAPLKYSRISSRYSKRRFHPVQKRWKAHLGTDYAAPTGTPIRTVGDGRIIAATYSRGNGRYVKVEHNSTYTTQYLHMSRIAKGIRKGKYVKQGEVIGYVGQTGLATGPHLCFRFWKNGVQVDPFKVKAPPTTPVSDANKNAYQKHANQWLKRLNQLNEAATEVTTKEEKLNKAP